MEDRVRVTLAACPALLALALAGALIASADDEVKSPRADPGGRIILNLAAHPDDEDGALLAYYSKALGARTAIIVATRGEGGQNATGGESGVELGALRSKEMAEAARILGADLYFLNLPDFGYSKSASETFRVWNKAAALERLVRLIREIGPDVIVTNHDTDTGHGHHRALAALALEAYERAADPEQYPVHAESGLQAHQAQRLFFRIPEARKGSFSIPVGDELPEIGRSPREAALEALRRHRTQGPWEGLPGDGGRDRQHYRLVRSAEPTAAKPQADLFAGIPHRPPWTRRYWEADDPAHLFSRGGAKLVAEAAFRLASTAEANPAQSRWLARRADILERRVWRTLQILSDLSVHPEAIAPGQEVEATLVLQNAGRQATQIQKIRFSAGDVAKEIEKGILLEPGERWTTVAKLVIPRDFPPTRPLAETLYLRDRVQPVVEVSLGYVVGGRNLVHRWRGDLEVRPAFSFRVEPPMRILPRGTRMIRRPAIVSVANRTAIEVEGEIWVDAPNGFARTSKMTVRLPPGETDHPILLRPLSGIGSGEYPFDVHLRIGTGLRIRRASVTIGDVKIDREARYLVLEGKEGSIEDFLRDLGVADVATEARPGSLDGFDVIVIGERASVAREGLRAFEEPLREFVRSGGHLVVLYHKTSEWDGRAPFAPYPLPLSRNRVTDQDGSVRILLPDHQILRSPNIIRPRDWTGWVQERGLYFPGDYSERYEEIIEVSDPHEKLLRGGILFAEFGEGSYLYTSLVWLRQIRAAHEGAARLLANILSPPAP
ncbi:MAG: PIG-L family deacetylase [Planctomycetota bacterium]|nr:PIG-L family deacetylase [Planctomycetota bacterium]